MIPPFRPLSGRSTTDPRALWSRALLFGGALLALWLALALLPSHPAPETHNVYADESGTVASRLPAEVGRGNTGSLVRPAYFFGLLLLAGGGAFALYLRRNGPTSHTGPALIRPLAHLPLSPGQQLRLVRCGDEVLLLGLTQSQVSLLRSYPAEDFPVDPPGSTGLSDGAIRRSFADTLSGFITPGNRTEEARGTR